MPQNKLPVTGETLKDDNGNEFTITRIWEWPDHYDYDLINRKTGELGYVTKKRKVVQ